MQQATRSRLEMAIQARDFMAANPLSDPGQAAIAARLETEVARAQRLAVEEQSGRLDAAQAIRRRKKVRGAIHRDDLRLLVRVGELAGRENPDLAGRFSRPGQSANNAYFLARSWDMLNRARSHRELLLQHGLGTDLLERLATSLTLYERVSERAMAARQAHVGARAELLEAVNRAVELVGVLDAINRPRFSGDPKALGAWASASNVNGPPHKRAPSPEPPTGPGPVATAA